ncbi:Auxin Efflux Carrier [Mameliella alba]|uniref:Auxin Efflux Carrier n=1 Tax=Mameliella alba TaxID=561184 RepID=A0A0B3RVS3_9RHOB|nr:Auxin Efflux Carrier [Mameliella alba]
MPSGRAVFSVPGFRSHRDRGRPVLFITIWPLFALICLGYVLARKGFPDAGFWPAAERINYFLLFPALLVSSLVDAPLGDPQILRLGAAALVVILLAAVGLALARRLFPAPAARFGPALQGTVRFNTYLGLAVTVSLAGDVGIERAAVYLAICVPVVNVLSIMALSEREVLSRPGALVRTMLKNPLILACLAGITLALLGLGLPYGLGTFMELLARGSLPLGLLCVGAALQPRALGRDGLVVGGNAALRLLGMPMLAAGVALVFGLDGVEALVLVVFSAIPTAPTAYVLTRQLGGDGTLMAGLVTAQTLAAIVTIPLVLLVLGYG